MMIPLVGSTAPAPDSQAGLLGRSRFQARLQAANLEVISRMAPERLLTYAIGGRNRLVAQPITFTPFASARPCSARCAFCSETLVHRQARQLSASLRPKANYFDGLRCVLRELRALPLGISLSGLEATDDAAWLLGVLDVLEEHARAGGIVEDKVLYTNTAGLARETTGNVLLPRLREYGLTRAEVSRHHWEQDANDRIMRFRRGQAVREQAVFERTVTDLLRHVPVRLVCVMQACGVGSPESVRAYLAWAASLGVRDVVFRELSRLGGEYQPNATARYVERERVGLEDLLEQLWPEGGTPGDLVPYAVTAGYYFWNLRLRGRDGLEVTFETSDYEEMKSRHQSGAVYKFIYHANGNLCGDWDPEREVLLSTQGPSDD